MTVLEVIQRTTEFLEKKGVDSPRLQVELLLSHVLSMPRMKLYLNFERPLAAGELDTLRELVKRRAQREPLQHILGSTSFCGLEMAVTPKVLVPRPETEILAELGWQFLSSRTNGPAAALDFGTGSGCLAIALATHCPGAVISALDVSPEALEVARRNAERHQVADRIRFFEGDGFAALPKTGRFDLIISNPPYIPSGEIAGLDPEVRDHDPRLALDGGADGLDFYRRLAREAGPWLAADGKMMMELGDDQAEPAKKVFTDQMWIVEAVHDDYSRRPRILVVRPAA